MLHLLKKGIIMIKQITLHHNFIKCIAVIIGYSIWAILAQQQAITVHVKLPICFYQTSQDYELQAPEYVQIALSGYRKDLSLYDPEENALHINASNYPIGTHEIKLDKQNLFLPNNIKLVQLKPASIKVEIIKK